MYKYIHVVVAALSMYACGNEPSVNKPVDVLNGSTAITVEQIYSVMNYVDMMAGTHVDLTNYTLTVHGTVEESIEACAGGEVACHNKAAMYIHAPWPTEYMDYDRATLNAISAYTLCHEMGHAHLYHTTGNGDGDHTHTEWFDGNDPTSVCGRVYDHYNRVLE